MGKSDGGIGWHNRKVARNKYTCRKCKAHGKDVPVERHKRMCPFRFCGCSTCTLINYSRNIVAKQIAVFRNQRPVETTKDHDLESSSSLVPVPVPGPKTTESPDYPIYERVTGSSSSSNDASASDATVRHLDGSPQCRRCRNHGESRSWKGHKRLCPFRHCGCESCLLIGLRKTNERCIREVTALSHSQPGTSVYRRLPVHAHHPIPATIVNTAVLPPPPDAAMRAAFRYESLPAYVEADCNHFRNVQLLQQINQRREYENLVTARSSAAFVVNPAPLVGVPLPSNTVSLCAALCDIQRANIIASLMNQLQQPALHIHFNSIH